MLKILTGTILLDRGEGLARHYLTAVSVSSPATSMVYEIPAPAVDMVSNQSRFGTSSTYVSGGGYVRRSQFGAQTLNVSWNNLNSEDIAALRNLNEAGMFAWDNPMARSNPALPWLARHGNMDETSPGSLGFSTQTYTLGRLPRVSAGRAVNLFGSYIGYPGRSIAMKYTLNSLYHALGLFTIPEGYQVRAWAVGETTGTAAIQFTTSTDVIPFNKPTTHNTDLPTDYVIFASNAVPVWVYGLTGSGEMTLQSLQLRVEPIGSPEEPLTYKPGLGNSGMEFTEEGLSIVQHSAALDMQSATATWMETGWWK